MKEFFGNYSILELALMAVAAVSFLIQVFYYAARYSRIPRFRQKVDSGVVPGVSVVVIVEDEMEYLTGVLPGLLNQDYEKFEIVVVDNGSSAEFAETLKIMCTHNPKLRSTRITPDPKFTYRRKFALNVGVKACTYPNVIFTETDTLPRSKKWLSLMAKGFSAGEVVIGYCGIEPEKGFASKMMRCGRLMQSVRYLSAAISHRPYKANSRNMGFSSKLYFDNRGYNYLDLSVGDDDLFIQKIATRENVSVVLNPNAAVRQRFYGGLLRWFRERKYYSYTYRYYPKTVRFSIFTELLTRFTLLGCVAALVALQTPIVWMVAAVMLLLRYFITFAVLSRVCRRLGERKLVRSLLIHDVVSPFYEAVLSVSRSLNPSKGVWT